MAIHPDVAERFALLEGIDSFEHLRSDPELEARFHAFMQYREAAPPPSVPTEDTTVPGPHGPVPIRIYRPSGAAHRPAFVWIHGGAFMFGDIEMPESDRTAREVADRADAVVVTVDYRLAVGGVHYPVPHDDCVAVVRWLRDHADEQGVDPGRIFVGGASAGANLATGATLRLRDEDGWCPAGLIPVYGVFHYAIPAPRPAVARLLDDVPSVLRMPPADTAGVAANYVGGAASRTDGYAMPANADLEGLCPVLVINAEYDDLRPSGESFAALLALAGVDVRQVLATSMMHGFLNLPAEIEPVDRVFALMADTVAAIPLALERVHA